LDGLAEAGEVLDQTRSGAVLLEQRPEAGELGRLEQVGHLLQSGNAFILVLRVRKKMEINEMQMVPDWSGNGITGLGAYRGLGENVEAEREVHVGQIHECLDQDLLHDIDVDVGRIELEDLEEGEVGLEIVGALVDLLLKVGLQLWQGVQRVAALLQHFRDLLLPLAAHDVWLAI
jgi:hypothetical protein